MMLRLLPLSTSSIGQGFREEPTDCNIDPAPLSFWSFTHPFPLVLSIQSLPATVSYILGRLSSFLESFLKIQIKNYCFQRVDIPRYSPILSHSPHLALFFVNHKSNTYQYIFVYLIFLHSNVCTIAAWVSSNLFTAVSIKLE